MATEIIKSTPVSNASAIPKVPNSSFLDTGILRTSRGSVTLTSGATTGSVYPLVRIPTNARVVAVRLTNAAGSASSACSVGVYKCIDSGATADATTVAFTSGDVFFASAQAMTSANTDLDVTGTTYTIAKREQPIWQAVGAAADPGGHYDICLTNTATNAATFAASVEVLWTI